MSRVLQFCFRPSVPLGEAEMTLHLAHFAAEGLAGPVRVQLDSNTLVDRPSRSIFIDESTIVGWLIARIFAGLLVREFGEAAFQVQRGVVRPTPTVVVECVAREVAA